MRTAWALLLLFYLALPVKAEAFVPCPDDPRATNIYYVIVVYVQDDGQVMWNDVEISDPEFERYLQVAAKEDPLPLFVVNWTGTDRRAVDSVLAQIVEREFPVATNCR